MVGLGVPGTLMFFQMDWIKTNHFQSSIKPHRFSGVWINSCPESPSKSTVTSNQSVLAPFVRKDVPGRKLEVRISGL